MDGYTDGYVEFVLEQLTQAKLECADPLVLIEQRLDFSCWVPEGFGTGDCLIVASPPPCRTGTRGRGDSPPRPYEPAPHWA